MAVPDGDSEGKKGEYMGRAMPYGVSGWSYRLSNPVLGSYTGQMSPLD